MSGSVPAGAATQDVGIPPREDLIREASRLLAEERCRRSNARHDTCPGPGETSPLGGDLFDSPAFVAFVTSGTGTTLTKLFAPRGTGVLPRRGANFQAFPEF